MDFQVHSSEDILLQEFPIACLQIQQQKAGIDYVDREESCSMFAHLWCYADFWDWV
jgi:hypothetical protein